MFRVPSISGLFKWRQFEPEVILLAVGWYLRFSLSYRDVEELLAERGLHAHHVTVWRWVQRYAPEMERRLRRRLKPTNDSWRGRLWRRRRSYCPGRRVGSDIVFAQYPASKHTVGELDGFGWSVSGRPCRGR
jgi:hypothetical protein